MSTVSTATARGLRVFALTAVVIVAVLATRAMRARQGTVAMPPEADAPEAPETQEPSSSALPARRRTARGLLSAATVVAASVAIAVAGTGVSYALWTSTVRLDGGTISSGSTAITINGAQDYTIGWGASKIGPGNPLFTTLKVANAGTTPVTTTMTTTSFAQANALADNLTVTIATLAAGDTCDARLTAAVAKPLVGFTAPAPAIPAGESVDLCLGMSLAGAAPATVQGGTASFTMTIDAVQVPRP